MAQEYADLSRHLDAVMGHFGQIPTGRHNGFHLERIFAWKGNQPSRREYPPDMFAIMPPRTRG